MRSRLSNFVALACLRLRDVLAPASCDRPCLTHRYRRGGHASLLCQDGELREAARGYWGMYEVGTKVGLFISSPPCFSSSVPPSVSQRFSFDVLERILLLFFVTTYLGTRIPHLCPLSFAYGKMNKRVIISCMRRRGRKPALQSNSVVWRHTAYCSRVSQWKNPAESTTLLSFPS